MQHSLDYWEGTQNSVRVYSKAAAKSYCYNLGYGISWFIGTMFYPSVDTIPDPEGNQQQFCQQRCRRCRRKAHCLFFRPTHFEALKATKGCSRFSKYGDWVWVAARMDGWVHNDQGNRKKMSLQTTVGGADLTHR